jgi:hypothetical protein
MRRGYMQKLTLSLDTLTVQSFPTAAVDPHTRGTVQAAEARAAAFAPSMFDHTACSCPYTCPKPY